MEKGLIFREGRQLTMTALEVEMLSFFVARANRTIPRQEILTAVWGHQRPVKTRTDHAAILRLRKKIERDASEPDHLVTVYGIGYRFDWADAPEPVIAPSPQADAVVQQAESLNLLALSSEDLPVQFGRYRLLSILGEGGNARVFKAQLQGASGFTKTLAIKAIKKATADDLVGARKTLFLKEARLGGLLRHPNLVDVYELGEESNQLYLAMEWVDGPTLREVLKHRVGLPPAVVCTIGRALCGALIAAHELEIEGERVGLVHRDLKPSNILLGKQGTVKLADWGLAHMAHRPDEPYSSSGSMGYMSPEQWSGAPTDHSSDLFTLGILLFEMATGKSLVDHVLGHQRAIRDVEQGYEKSGFQRTINAYVPGLGDVIQRCLRLDPSQRYQRAAQIESALQVIQLRVSRYPELAQWLANLERGGPQAAVADIYPTVDSITSSVLDGAFASSGVGSVQTNLPLEPNRFVGRGEEIEEISSDLANGRRVVVLTGPPGAGKTRLVRRIAAQRFDAGECSHAWFCDLRPTRDGAQLLRRVASILGVEINGSGAKEPSLQTQIGLILSRQSQPFIVLDNAEHLIDEVSHHVNAWWAAAPNATFVITSRTTCPMSMAKQMMLNPCPLLQADASLEQAKQNMAIQLFVARARAVNARFELTADNLAEVIQITRLVDGLPLAIELAAARMRAWTVSTLAKRLSVERLAVLSTRKTSDAIHALRSTLEWSWSLLTPWEQAALAQCSVFRGGFTWEAAEDVVSLLPWPEAPWAVDVVQSLTEQSLISVGEGPTGEARLEYLESIADFAKQKLLDMGDEWVRSTRRRHATHFATFGMDECIEALSKHEGQRRLLELEVERFNISEGLTYAKEVQAVLQSFGLARALMGIANHRGDYGNVIDRVERVLEMNVPDVERAKLLYGLSVMARIGGPVDQSLGYCRRGLVLAERERHIVLQARFQILLAILCRVQGRMDESLAHQQRAHTLVESSGDLGLQAQLLSEQGIGLRIRGQYSAAEKCLKQALLLLRETGDIPLQFGVLNGLANIHNQQLDYSRARKRYQQALKVAQQQKQRRYICTALGNLALMDFKLKAYANCKQGAELALDEARGMGLGRNEAFLLGLLGQVFHAEESAMDEAEEHLMQAIRMFEGLGDTRMMGAHLGYLGEVYTSLERYQDAIDVLNRALKLHRKMENIRAGGYTLARLGWLKAHGSDLDAARSDFDEAERLIRQLNEPLHLLWVLCQRAEAEWLSNQVEVAERRLTQIETLCVSRGLQRPKAVSELQDKIKNG